MRAPHLPAAVSAVIDRRATSTTSSSPLGPALERLLTEEARFDRRTDRRHRRVRVHRLARRRRAARRRPPRARPRPAAAAQRDDADWADVDMLDQDAPDRRAARAPTPVFHLAAMADVNDIVADPAESVALNTLGTVARARSGAPRRRRPRRSWRARCGCTRATHGDDRRRDDAVRPRHRPPPLRVDEDRGRDALPRLRTRCSAGPYTVLRYGIPYGPRMRSDLRRRRVLHAGDARRAAAHRRRRLAGAPLRVRRGPGAAPTCWRSSRSPRTARTTSTATSRSRSGSIAETVRDLVGDVEVTFGPSRPGDSPRASCRATGPATSSAGSRAHLRRGHAAHARLVRRDARPRHPRTRTRHPGG